MISKGQLKALLDRHGVRPNRRLGQNFLVDPNLLGALVRDAGPQPGQHVLEVGAGAGVLTAALLAAGCRVTAVEIDHRLAAILRERFGQHPRLRLIEDDACKLDYTMLFEPIRPFRCIANLPYASSSVFVARMASLEHRPVDLHVLLQREMAARLSAEPHTKAYAALTVNVRLRYDVAILRHVPPEVFYPAPEVDSAFVRLSPAEHAVSAATASFAANLAAAAFRHRRKTAIKGLSSLVPRAQAENALRRLDLPLTVRAEDITVAQFAALAACLAQQERTYWPPDGQRKDPTS